MQTKPLTPLDQKFLDAIDHILSVNNTLKIEPSNYNAMGLLLNPSSRNILYDIQQGRRHINYKYLVTLAQCFRIDMNYFFYEGFHINYNPVPKEKQINTALSLVNDSFKDLQTSNHIQFNTLSLATDLYQKIDALLQLQQQHLTATTENTESE